ncbi:MAG TPA: hypothetical protein VGM01_05505 [Ktedonobacteraceae bacterium]
MPGSSFFFSPLLISAFIIWIVTALSIRLDLHRMHNEYLQGKLPLWYERPILWFAASGISVGLALAAIAGWSFSFLISVWVIFGSSLLFTLFLVGGIIMASERPFSKPDAAAEEARLRQLAASSSGPIAKTSIVTNMYLVGMILYAIIMVTGMCLLFMPGNWLIILIAGLISLVAFIVRMLVLRRLSRRLNRRRRLLMDATTWPIMTEKPCLMASEPISSEPVQILASPLVLRLKRWVVIGYLGIMATFMLSWLSRPAIPMANIIIQILIDSCIFLIPLLRSMRASVEATSEDLVVSEGIWIFQRKKYRQRMIWENARLFVCYKTPGFFGGKATMTYELSNSWQGVQWTRLLDTRSPFALWKMEIPMDEYNQRTQALCACITEQTGLQLHDVSEETLKEYKREMVTGRSQTQIETRSRAAQRDMH